MLISGGGACRIIANDIGILRDDTDVDGQIDVV